MQGTKTQAYESPTKQKLAHDKQTNSIKIERSLGIGAQPETNSSIVSSEDH